MGSSMQSTQRLKQMRIYRKGVRSSKNEHLILSSALRSSSLDSTTLAEAPRSLRLSRFLRRSSLPICRGNFLRRSPAGAVSGLALSLALLSVKLFAAGSPAEEGRLCPVERGSRRRRGDGHPHPSPPALVVGRSDNFEINVQGNRVSRDVLARGTPGARSDVRVLVPTTVTSSCCLCLKSTTLSSTTPNRSRPYARGHCLLAKHGALRTISIRPTPFELLKRRA